MPTYNMQADLMTGAIHAVGKSGRRYPLDQLAEAEADARRGDPAAQDLLRDLDLGLGDGRQLSRDEVVAMANRAIHDCPECQAAGVTGPLEWVSATELATASGWISAADVRATRLARARRRRAARARSRDQARVARFAAQGVAGAGSLDV